MPERKVKKPFPRREGTTTRVNRRKVSSNPRNHLLGFNVYQVQSPSLEDLSDTPSEDFQDDVSDARISSNEDDSDSDADAEHTVKKAPSRKRARKDKPRVKGKSDAQDQEEDNLEDDEGYTLVKEFSDKVLKLAEETIANQTTTTFTVKQLLDKAKLMNSATSARIKIKKYTSWNVVLEEMKKHTEKLDREPTREMQNGRKAFTGRYAKIVKETYHANKGHYKELADQRNEELKAGETEALVKTQTKAIQQRRKFVSPSYPIQLIYTQPGPADEDRHVLLLRSRFISSSWPFHRSRTKR
jgi:hypothetical protein